MDQIKNIRFIRFIKRTIYKDSNVFKQEVQGLQAFAFPVETVYDEHAKSRLKRKLRGKFEEVVCVFKALT